ncbi:MAG TPA: hypothetical protein DCM87_08390 [Planctomycetes bacterium]|nr:hypothetical protein [Planctomycetota bacterium]
MTTEPFDATMRRGGAAAIREAGRFFMKADPVFQTLKAISQRLTAAGIPHCVAGGMALVAHGYDRTTIDVDILVTEEGLREAHRRLEGLGYVRPFAGSRNLRDTATGVRIKFLVAGQFPGDGKPKPVAFPDPAKVSVEIDGIRFLGLPALVELKLASGMTAAHRLKDLADVQELVRVLTLPRELADRLDPYVRDKFVELWTAVRESPPEG